MSFLMSVLNVLIDIWCTKELTLDTQLGFIILSGDNQISTLQAQVYLLWITLCLQHYLFRTPGKKLCNSALKLHFATEYAGWMNVI